MNKEESEQDKINNIDLLDEKWSSKKLRRELKVDLVGNREIKYPYDTVFVLSYFDKNNQMRYRINCSIYDSTVDIIFIDDKDDVVKRTRYVTGVDSFQVVHLLDHDFIFSKTANKLNTDSIPFLTQEDKLLFNRALNIKNK
jgi:hypothetical protein